MVETYPSITQSWYNWEFCNERKNVFFCNRLSCQSTYLLIGKKSASSSTVPKRKNLFSVNWSKYIQVCQDEWPQSPKHTHKNTQKHKLSLTHKHTHPLTLKHSHTHTTPTRICSHIHTHMHTHNITHSLIKRKKKSLSITSTLKQKILQHIHVRCLSCCHDFIFWALFWSNYFFILKLWL